jgi:hypothetical protein
MKTLGNAVPKSRLVRLERSSQAGNRAHFRAQNIAAVIAIG